MSVAAAPGVDVSAWPPLGCTTYGFAVCKPEKPAPLVEPCIYCLREQPTRQRLEVLS